MKHLLTLGFDIEHEVIPIPVKGKRTYVDPLTYASPDEAVQEFAKEIEPKVLRLDAGIGSGERLHTYINMRQFVPVHHFNMKVPYLV